MWVGRRFLALPHRERWLALKAWLLLAGVRASLGFGLYRRTSRLLGWLHRRPVDRLVREGIPPARVARLLAAASHAVPSGRHCLSRAMALETLLRRRGHPARIEFGVDRTASGGLEAHAWVVCGQEILIGGPGVTRFTPMSPAPAACRDDR